MNNTSFFDKIKLRDDTLIRSNKCIIEDTIYQNKTLNLKNLIHFTKLLNNNINNNNSNNKYNNNSNNNNNNNKYNKNIIKSEIKNKEPYYFIKQKDTLFWCFYILKNGYSSYEMDCYNKYFTIEREVKYKYINFLREDKNKNLLKMFKIKPLIDLENDLANKDKITVKTFFALCLIEGINVMLIDGRKVYNLSCNDSDINIIHYNKKSDEYYIESEINNSNIDNYKLEYFVVPTFDYKLKSISSYKVDELVDLCKKLNIDLDNRNSTKKILKKDIYELVVQEFR